MVILGIGEMGGLEATLDSMISYQMKKLYG
jgi:hypothetical protein